MTSCSFVCVVFVAISFNVVLTAENVDEDYQKQNNIERPVDRSYSVTSCDYRSQLGYSCLSCHRALHCYPGNIAILVDCYGIFRHCRDGRCSWLQSEKCVSDSKLTTPSPALKPSFPTSEVTDNVDAASNADATTKVELEVITEAASLPMDSNTTTKSDVSTTNSDISTTKNDVSTTKSDASTTKSDASTIKSDASMIKSKDTTTISDASTTTRDVSLTTDNNIV